MKLTKRSFSKFYDKFAPKVYRFILFKVGKPEVAQDITSDTFLKAWQYCQRVEITYPQAVFYQMARQQIADFYRRQKVRLVSLDQEPEIVDSGLSLDEQLIQGDEQRRTLVALATLPNEQQEILTWRYIDGYSYQQIGKIISKPSGTVRVISHRALKKLKTELGERA